MPNKPKVSVLMPAYKGEKYIREAIDSVLAQTFADFELLIILNEASDSTDKSREIIESYSDPRIRLVRNEKMGLSIARNKGIKSALGEYIANLDCDDRSHPSRLQKQVDFLDANTNFGLVGSFIENIDKNGHATGNIWSFPAPAEEVPAILFFSNYFAQSATMIRKSALPTKHYDPDMPVAEDYDLWIRIAEKNKVWNLPEILTQIRNHGENNTIILAKLHPPTTKKIYAQQLTKLGLSYSTEELDDHYLYCVGQYEATTEHTERLKTWFDKMNMANSKAKVYDQIIFTKALFGRWYLFCKKSGRHWWLPNRMFWKGARSLTKDFGYREKTIMFYKSIKQILRKFVKVNAK